MGKGDKTTYGPKDFLWLQPQEALTDEYVRKASLLVEKAKEALAIRLREKIGYLIERGELPQDTTLKELDAGNILFCPTGSFSLPNEFRLMFRQIIKGHEKLWHIVFAKDKDRNLDLNKPPVIILRGCLPNSTDYLCSP